MSRWTFPGTWVVLVGIGFTMALFITNPDFSRNQVDSAKSGIFLVSVVSALRGIVLLSGLSGYGNIHTRLITDA